MKKIFTKGYIFFIALIFGLLFCPYVVNAEKYSSNFIKINDNSYSYTGEDFSLSQVYFRKSTSNSSLASYGALFGKMVNLSDHYLSAYMTIDYYDENYKIIARSTKKESPGLAKDNYSMNIILYDNDFLGDFNFDDIKYYKINYYTEKGNPLPGSAGSSSNTTIKKPSSDSQNGYRDYVIDKYDVNIKVNENNTLDITETITAYFNVSKHGIYRTIPLKNNVTRLDGTMSKNRVQIYDLNINDEYKTSRENENLKIQIGSADKTFKGEKLYTIKYTYNMGKDPMEEYDELYYDIIGDSWDTVIGNVTFSITMPKEFDSSKLGFSSGKYGSVSNSDIKYTVEGNKITGSYDGVLGPFEGLTVRVELPEGYFVGAGLKTDYLSYLSCVIPIIFLVIAILLWYKFGKEEQVVETVEFYPPEDFNSLEVGFLYKGEADSQDVTSLLIYLANKGYIKIEETEEKSLFSKSKGFKIIKLKDYDGDNINERMFFNGLFSTKSLYSSLLSKDDNTPINNVEVNITDLYNRFYITTDKILLDINSKENKRKIINKLPLGIIIFISLMIIATYCLITIPPILIYGEPFFIIFGLLFPGIGFTFMFSMLISKPQTIYVNGKKTHSSFFTKLFGLIWGGMFGGMPWLFLVLPMLLQDKMYLIGYLVGLVCIFIMIACIKNMPKRTPYGNQILGRLRGFKNFLETAEKEKLEAMVMQDPSYFYNILPYTYVLGVSDKWIKKFETISMQAPSWYGSNSGFNVLEFGTFMNRTMVSAQNVMSSSRSHSSSSYSGSSSSSSSSSGGGFSGGGSGGGGGGSW